MGGCEGGYSPGYGAMHAEEGDDVVDVGFDFGADCGGLALGFQSLDLLARMVSCRHGVRAWAGLFTSCVKIVGRSGDIAFWATERCTTEDKEARSSSIHSEPSSKFANPSSGSW